MLHVTVTDPETEETKTVRISAHTSQAVSTLCKNIDDKLAKLGWEDRLQTRGWPDALCSLCLQGEEPVPNNTLVLIKDLDVNPLHMDARLVPSNAKGKRDRKPDPEADQRLPGFLIADDEPMFEVLLDLADSDVGNLSTQAMQLIQKIPTSVSQVLRVKADILAGSVQARDQIQKILLGKDTPRQRLYGIQLLGTQALSSCVWLLRHRHSTHRTHTFPSQHHWRPLFDG